MYKFRFFIQARVIKSFIINIFSNTYKNGGEGGIRTHGRLQTYANFQDWCHKPTRPPLRITATISCNSIYNNTFKAYMSIAIIKFLYPLLCYLLYFFIHIYLLLLIYIAKNKIKILLYNLIIIFLQLPF